MAVFLFVSVVAGSATVVIIAVGDSNDTGAGAGVGDAAVAATVTTTFTFGLPSFPISEVSEFLLDSRDKSPTSKNRAFCFAANMFTATLLEPLFSPLGVVAIATVSLIELDALAPIVGVVTEDSILGGKV